MISKDSDDEDGANIRIAKLRIGERESRKVKIVRMKRGESGTTLSPITVNSKMGMIDDETFLSKLEMDRAQTYIDQFIKNWDIRNSKYVDMTLNGLNVS